MTALVFAAGAFADTKYGMPEKFRMQNVIDLSPDKIDRAGGKGHAESVVIAKHQFLIPTYENKGTRFKVVNKRPESEKFNLFNLK